MFDPLSLILGLALAAEPSPAAVKPVLPAGLECNELFRGHRSVYEGRHFICVDGVWREEDKSIQPVKPRPP